MADWTHPICDPCWLKLRPGDEPLRFKEDARRDHICCSCGAGTRSGIYLRLDPASLAHCDGDHEPVWYECECCERRNVPVKLKGIGYVCEDCLVSYTWDYGRYPPGEDPPKHYPACPFKMEAT